ncbi:hypothetical protein GM3709_1844 [Geminocystis sp. NIES-3709]|nr:hypothetical protein GM3709_1844 [Geminocystis sp. NIES-3709]
MQTNQEIKGWLGLSQYQVRKRRSLMRYFKVFRICYTL